MWPLSRKRRRHSHIVKCQFGKELYLQHQSVVNNWRKKDMPKVKFPAVVRHLQPLLLNIHRLSVSRFSVVYDCPSGAAVFILLRCRCTSFSMLNVPYEIIDCPAIHCNIRLRNVHGLMKIKPVQPVLAGIYASSFFKDFAEIEATKWPGRIMA